MGLLYLYLYLYTFLLQTVSTPRYSAAERFMLTKNSSDTIGNRTRYRIVAQCPNQLRHRVPPQCLNQLRHRVPQARNSTVYLYVDTDLMAGGGFPSTKQGSTAV